MPLEDFDRLREAKKELESLSTALSKCFNYSAENTEEQCKNCKHDIGFCALPKKRRHDKKRKKYETRNHTIERKDIVSMKLKPCPFCGSTDIIITWKTGHFYAQCTSDGNCRARTGECKTDIIAADMWNLRTRKKATSATTDDEKTKKFIPPTLEGINQYCAESGHFINAEAFIDYYTSVKWAVGKKKMADWKAAVRNWERRTKEFEKDKKNSKRSGFADYTQREHSTSELEDLWDNL